MEALATVLPIIIYFLLIILLIILITFGIKLLMAVMKLQKVVDDFTKRMEAFSGLFGTLDFIADKISRFGDVALDFISSKVKKMSKRKKYSEMEEDEDE